MLAYPVKLSLDSNGTILAAVPDLPEAVTFGDDEAEAVARIADVIEDCLSEYVTRKLPIPAPSRPKRGQKLATVSALVEMKLAIHQAMLADGVSKTELARRLNCHLPQVDRLLDLGHASRLDRIEAALRVLGKRLSVEIQAAQEA
jgi:antitoxin HicB